MGGGAGVRGKTRVGVASVTGRELIEAMQGHCILGIVCTPSPSSNIILPVGSRERRIGKEHGSYSIIGIP